MDNRKRPRMETTATTALSLNGGVGATTTTIGGQSIYLTNASAADTLGVLPANVFLTICDDNSDESDEYLTIDGNTLAQIKQEQDIGTQTQTLPLQYRIINHLQRQTMSPTESSATASLSSLSSQTLPASVQLPSGCEIYLVKEYIESPATTLSASSGSNDLFVQTPMPTVATTTTTTIKVEPDSPIAARTRTGTVAGASGGVAGVSNVQITRGNIPCLVTSKKTPTNATETAPSASSSVEGNNGKRSFILEAYKKRDDKRRATHNEVERRRRDKINSWIFKLKEMLPTEIPNNNIIMTTTNTAANTINNNCTAAVTSTSSSTLSNEQQQRNININNSRTPPSDSKSQILIKACDYIKAMQDEIKSLRECLTENENLRVSNQRLQSELNKIRNERSNSNNLVNGNSNNSNNNNNNPNSNYNITLNSLNSNGLFGAGTATVIGNVNNGATASYTKRELIITDYVD